MSTQPNFPLNVLRFDNRFLQELPADPLMDNRPRQVYGACYSRVLPAKASQPKLVAYSREVASQLNLDTATCESADFSQVFAGNRVVPGMDPYACCYGGHQFGQWAGQLGDGRAINLGEALTGQGEHLTLQLKGAGPTPYARNADGLAVLRSSIREFLCSEAMHHLGVPTTRALSVVMTGRMVKRDMFYDGNPKWEPGAIVCRVAPSFTRFGNFQIFTARGDHETLKCLADFTIRHDFPHLGAPASTVYLNWFEEVCQKTAEMIVHWQRVGFVHGVMNTDNMSILGLTLDYGPYGWLENYDPAWTPNTTDAHGRRYCFGNQPQIAYWNLAQLANAIYPLIQQIEPLQEALRSYISKFEQGWRNMMINKLGLVDFEYDDETLVTDLLVLLQMAETDMTLFYRELANPAVAGAESDFQLMLENCSYAPLSSESKEFAETWRQKYLMRRQRNNRTDEARTAAMNAVNPRYVLRNYLAQQAIDNAEQGDFGLIWELLDVLRAPYADQPGKRQFMEKRPEWARDRAGCSMLSCSS